VTGIVPYEPHWGTWKVAHLPGTLRDGHVSLSIGGPGEGGRSTRNFEKSLKEGSDCGASLSMGGLLGELGVGRLLYWGP
jgi:hypothetical protein